MSASSLNSYMALSKKQVKDSWERTFWNGEDGKFAHYVDAYRRCLDEFGLDGTEFKNEKIGEIGTGPFSGFLPFFKANTKVSIDPLNQTYKDDGILVEYKDIEYFSDEFEKYKGKGFNALFCKNALDHGDMSFATLKEIAAALADGGKFYLIVNLRIEAELNACHDHALTIEDCRKYASENKLTIIKEDIWPTDKIHGDVYRTLCAVFQK